MVWLAPFKTFELKDVLVEGRFEMCTGLLRAPETALVTVRNGEEDDIVQVEGTGIGPAERGHKCAAA